MLVLRTRWLRHSSLVFSCRWLLCLGRNAPVDVSPGQRLHGPVALRPGGHGAIAGGWRGRAWIVRTGGMHPRDQREKCAAAGEKRSDTHGMAPFRDGEDGGSWRRIISAHRMPCSRRNFRRRCDPLYAGHARRTYSASGPRGGRSMPPHTLFGTGSTGGRSNFWLKSQGHTREVLGTSTPT